ncbi:MAG: hypothetical protein ACW99A_14530, partial [Candidatus Kariarchaeaceae archaeon]
MNNFFVLAKVKNEEASQMYSNSDIIITSHLSHFCSNSNSDKLHGNCGIVFLDEFDSYFHISRVEEGEITFIIAIQFAEDDITFFYFLYPLLFNLFESNKELIFEAYKKQSFTNLDKLIYVNRYHPDTIKKSSQDSKFKFSVTDAYVLARLSSSQILLLIQALLNYKSVLIESNPADSKKIPIVIDKILENFVNPQTYVNSKHSYFSFNSVKNGKMEYTIQQNNLVNSKNPIHGYFKKTELKSGQIEETIESGIELLENTISKIFEIIKYNYSLNEMLKNYGSAEGIYL